MEERQRRDEIGSNGSRVEATAAYAYVGVSQDAEVDTVVPVQGTNVGMGAVVVVVDNTWFWCG